MTVFALIGCLLGLIISAISNLVNIVKLSKEVKEISSKIDSIVGEGITQKGMFGEVHVEKLTDVVKKLKEDFKYVESTFDVKYGSKVNNFIDEEIDRKFSSIEYRIEQELDKLNEESTIDKIVERINRKQIKND